MKIKKILLAIALSASLTAAHAASVSLVYTGANDIDDDGAILAAAGDTLTFDLVMDFTDQITLGGGFDINWDSSVFALESYVSAGLGDPSFGRDPVLEDGRLFNGAVGNFNGLTEGLIATLSFQVLAFPATMADGMITPSGTDGDSGPWIDGVTFVDVIDDVEYNGLGIRVPVPAAVWFMLSGLGVLAGMGRRRAS
ncbi:MAG: VPLPA-CTERM sorting domain-containing protein [Gammaproteobacteria bacterium]